MDTVGETPPNSRALPQDDTPTDIYDLLIATRVINSEIYKMDTTPLGRVSIRLMMRNLLELALEIATDCECATPRYPTEHVVDDLPS